MRISVIIPAYNAASTLAECLESVARQSVRPFEVILVDDGSTDHTRRVAAKFEAKFTLRIVSQANSGLGKARNAGMAAATGDAYAFLDADDVWLPGKLEQGMKGLLKYPKTQWFYTPILEWTPDNENSTRKRACSQVSSLRSFLSYNPIVPSTIIMRSGFDYAWENDRNLQEDVGAHLRVLSRGDFPKMLSEATLKYRLDFGMTADAEGHVDKVMRAVTKARELGHISDAQFALYEVRKAYELARTYKKRGDQAMQKHWKKEALRKAEGVEVPARLKWRLRFFI
jgi:glycosyltransferase involved in cell wall biosynthesis